PREGPEPRGEDRGDLAGAGALRPGGGGPAELAEARAGDRRDPTGGLDHVRRPRRTHREPSGPGRGTDREAPDDQRPPRAPGRRDDLARIPVVRARPYRGPSVGSRG